MTEIDLQNRLLANPFILIDTQDYEIREKHLEKSIINEGEAEIVGLVQEILTNAKIEYKDIAVITPYAAQRRHIESKLPLEKDNPLVKCKTVDGFQGGESEAVIVSLVRSNSQARVGFLDDERRLNVAISRARR